MTRFLRLAGVLGVLALAPSVGHAVPTSWQSRGPGGGGALFSPSWSPHVPDDLFVACDMTELFRSPDAGRSWVQSDFRVIQGNRASFVSFTDDPRVLYTIDHSTIASVDLRLPVKSIDGGATWSALPGDPTGADSWAMLADPHDSRRVFVVDYGRLWFSDDGGTSFRNVYTDATGAGCYLAGLFTDGLGIYLGLNAGVLVSLDGGQTFALDTVTTGIDFGTEAMTDFAGAREGATTRFVCVTHARGDVYLGMYACEHWGYQSVYSRDLGQSAWTQRTTGIPAGDHPFFAGMSDGEIDVAWLSGGGDAGSPVVLRSTDGAQTWQPVLLTAGNANVATGWSGQGGDRGWGYGECAMGFQVSPADPLRAAISDYGFVHVTEDGGASWRQAYVAPMDENPAGANTPPRRSYASVGIENTTCWGLHWASPSVLIANYSDIGATRSTDGGVTWGFNRQGLGENSTYRVVQDPRNGRLFAGTSSVHDMYQSTRLADNPLDGGNGRVAYSDDLGATWQTLHDFGDSVVWVALDPTEPDTLYASVVHSALGGIFATRNLSAGAASTWTRLAVPPRTQGHPFNVLALNDGTLVATYSGRRTNVFTDSSGVFVSSDDGASWQDRSHAGMHYWTKDIAIAPDDPAQSTWYVGVFSGWGGTPNGLGGLYRTRDRGQSWTRIIALDRVTSLSISPLDPDEAYLTTETEGLWHVADLRAANPTFAQDPNYPFRQPERVFWNPNDLREIWVTSFGNGLRVGVEAVPPMGPDLLRSTDVTSLAPLTPPLASVFPLDPVLDLLVPDAQRGVLDPDATIVGDPTRPLAFYALTAPDTIRLSLTPARRVRVDW